MIPTTEFCWAAFVNGTSNIILLHYNLTGKLKMRRPQKEGFDVMTTLFIAVSCLIVLENLLVLLAIVKNMRFRRWVYCCIANITLSDLLTGIAYLINICLSGSVTFQLSLKVWFLREGILFIALAASIFSLLITAIERYTTMIRPSPGNEANKTIRVYSLIGFFWILASVIGLLPMLGWNCTCDFQNCSTLLPLYSKTYILFSVIMFSAFLIGIIGLYVAIYFLVQRSSKKTPPALHHRKKSLKLLKTVLMILGAFILCWSPLFALLMLDVFCQSLTCESLRGMDWALTLAVLNSAINPVIYSFRSLEVRKAILSFLCYCCIKTGIRGPSDCLMIADITLGSSTESSLRTRDSFRTSRPLSVMSREPLTSISSMTSA
ncbi:sphingosine 1-phosphate receptor 4 [Rhinatrema bivittatum]|uniref:sphingosine 1-phosphate receptor 4 n=1 Tax=Rhinatrema bivittatum TaxID=194408 RepID=UPI001126660F|nr:sphingosine 1-phosphate receptor 4 [Rhinatrema bivittatum]XP_029469764.1 sphingosine 1-phosphate receptor 4 [Rhinatrema bivittatum]